MATAEEKGIKPVGAVNGGSSKMKMIMLITIGAIVLIGASVGGSFMLARSMMHATAGHEAESESHESAGKGEKKKTDKKGKKGKQSKPDGSNAIYLPLDPPFVVNSQDQQASRFLQVTVELMTYDPAYIEELKKHMPLIRNSLVMLFSSQNVAELRTREGKEKLRVAALEEVQRVLEEQVGSSNIESLYFTSFVIQ